MAEALPAAGSRNLAGEEAELQKDHKPKVLLHSVPEKELYLPPCVPAWISTSVPPHQTDAAEPSPGKGAEVWKALLTPKPGPHSRQHKQHRKILQPLPCPYRWLLPPPPLSPTPTPHPGNQDGRRYLTHITFATSDLYNWEMQNPKFSEKPPARLTRLCNDHSPAHLG